MTGRPAGAPILAEQPGIQLALAVLEHQSVGTLVVDRETVVTYANPAAVEMLGVPAERLIGQAFGLPLVSESVSDLNVPGEGGSVRTLAMRVSALPQGVGDRLVTLFDVSGRARLYEHEHRLVETLQRSLLLERMPELPGVQLAARYIPGDGDVRVGGDWYDAIRLERGRIGLVIGDVAGHGIGSAALMSQLRNALRAYALEHRSTAEVVHRLDALLYHLEPTGMATMVYLIYEPEAGALSLTAAGHPYPLLAMPDGESIFLRGGRTLPLGTGAPEQREAETVTVPPGSTLVLYTDGLIERRSRPLDKGFERLTQVIRPQLNDPEKTCDAITDGLLGEEQPADDVAILVMRTTAV